MTAFWLVFGMMCGMVAYQVILLLLHRWEAGWRPQWMLLPGEVPWAPRRDLSALGARHGHSDLVFVSRHDLAECGLVCPVCKTEAAARGDFAAVRRTRINGRENEVVLCQGTIENTDGTTRKCGAWLAASPDTEHGDHLDPADLERIRLDDSLSEEEKAKATVKIRTDEPLDHYLFRRVTAQQVLRDRYGVDIEEVDEDNPETVDAEASFTAYKAPNHV